MSAPFKPLLWFCSSSPKNWEARWTEPIHSLEGGRLAKSKQLWQGSSLPLQESWKSHGRRGNTGSLSSSLLHLPRTMGTSQWWGGIRDHPSIFGTVWDPWETCHCSLTVLLDWEALGALEIQHFLTKSPGSAQTLTMPYFYPKTPLWSFWETPEIFSQKKWGNAETKFSLDSAGEAHGLSNPKHIQKLWCSQTGVFCLSAPSHPTWEHWHPLEGALPWECSWRDITSLPST